MSVHRKCRKAAVYFLSFVAIAFTANFNLPTAVAQDANNGGAVNPFYGSFSTEVPIAVPEYHGLEPQLKLVYNSTGRNGLAGVGWGLSGISYIERGVPGGGSPKYDANDAYFLDGMELVPSTLQGGTHCTKIQNYSRIEQDTVNNKWYVTGTNGNIATYEPLFQTSKGTFRWFLTSVQDPHGNVVNYNYWNDSNLSVYLDNITYNGITIKFYLESRSDAFTFATGAGLGKIRHRLKTVDVRTSTNRVRAYTFAYSSSATTSRSLLAYAQQYGKDAVIDASGTVISGTSLPAMEFGWQEGGDGFDIQTWPIWLDSSLSSPTYWTGDFNGDGKTDFASPISGSGGQQIRVNLSTGSGFDVQTWPIWLDCTLTSENYWTGDFNGDGKTDFASYIAGSSGQYIKVNLSTGSGFDVQTWPIWLDCSLTSPTYWTGDFNGDGKTDFASPISGSGGQQIRINLASSTPTDYLSTIQNGIGGTTTIEYTPSSAWDNTFLPVGMVMQTVSALTTDDGRGNSSTVNYSYEGGLWSSSERRFLGFRKVTAVLDAAGNYTETYYYQQEGSISKPEYTYYYDNQGNIFRYSEYQYDFNQQPPYTSLLTNRWEYDCNLTSTCYKTLNQFEYDQYGNVTRTYEWGEYQEDGQGNPIQNGDERTTTRGYYPNTTDYIVGLPAYENTYEGIGTSGTLIKQTLYLYDSNSSYDATPTKGDITEVKKWNDDTASYISAEMTHDAYGNIVAQTDERGYTACTVFDSTYHLYPVQEFVNVDGSAECSPSRCTTENHCITTAWDTVMALKNSVTDVGNNTTTSYDYDPLGRPLSETDPEGNVTSYEYLDWGNPNLQRIRKTVPDGTADGLVSETYQDGLGREYKQLKKSGPDDANYYIQETIFSDTSNRVWKKSLGHRVGETPRYIVYQYDGLGRQRIATNPDDTDAETVYGIDASGYPYTATYDELGHEKVVWKDAYGNLWQVREKNGGQYYYTTYEYDLNGNPVRIIDAQGNETTTTWDSLGRRLSTSDQNTGTWTYEYFNDGSLKKQTDARDKVTEFTYDPFGRVKTKSVEGQLAVEYFYDEAGYGSYSNNKLTRVVHADGSASETHTWNDKRGLETEVTRCVNGDCQTIGQSYDTLGRVDEITYPDSETVTNAYDEYGRLVSVSGYASGMTWNSSGQLAHMDYANGTENDFTYDANRKWLATATVTGPSLNTLYEAAYTYDNAARVTDIVSSTNLLLNMHFTYDDLNRLMTVTGQQSQTFDYNNIGNITSNSQVGSYSYNDPLHKQAVTAAGTNSYTYDANGNMLAATVSVNKTFVWNNNNKLESVTVGEDTTIYLYDHAGKRIEKSGPSGITKYFGALAELKDGVLIKYYYAGPILVAKKDSGGTYWYHSDHLGSTRLITDINGAEANTYDYAAYGETVNETGSVENERGFTGHVNDPDTGLIYMGARYYDATLGRFISADTVVPDPANPQALNRYSYVLNNPINNTDPTGHAPVAAAVVTALVVSSNAAWAITPLVVTAWVGAGLTTAGYFLHDPFLSTTGSVMLGFVGGYKIGASFLTGMGTASVQAAASPLSPLDPNAKMAIGWAFTAYGQIDFSSAAQFGKTALQFGLNEGTHYGCQMVAKGMAKGLGMNIEGFEASLMLGSFVGNSIAGSRYKGLDSRGFEKIEGFFSRGDEKIRGIFDVVDTVLEYQGIPSASSYEYLTHGNLSAPLWGHSLGSVSVSNLGALGAPASSITAAALPFGAAGAARVHVDIGTGDPITGYGANFLLNPFADSIPQQGYGISNHNKENYLRHYIN